MKRKYTIGLFGSGIEEFIKGLEEYEQWLRDGAERLCQKLANYGLVIANAGFDSAIYDGAQGDYQLTVDDRGELTKAVVAVGDTVLFIEFGTGVVYPDSHPDKPPEVAPRGTYGKGHGSQNTWGFYGEELGTYGKFATDAQGNEKTPHVVLTHGNPANMPMYNAVKYLEEEFPAMVKEAFGEW